MYSVTAEVYTSKPSTKCVVPLAGEKNANRFLFASCNIQNGNEIHLVEYDEKASRVFCERIYEHESEIVNMSPCPYDPSIVAIISRNEEHKNVGKLYKITKLPVSLQTEEKEDIITPSNAKEEIATSKEEIIIGPPNELPLESSLNSPAGMSAEGLIDGPIDPLLGVPVREGLLTPTPAPDEDHISIPTNDLPIENQEVKNNSTETVQEEISESNNEIPAEIPAENAESAAESGPIADVVEAETITESTEIIPEGPKEEDIKIEEEEDQIEESSKIQEEMVEEEDDSQPELIYICDIPGEGIIDVLWHPELLETADHPHSFICIYNHGYSYYRILEDSSLEEIDSFPIEKVVHAASWDPLHPLYLCVAADEDVLLINIQTKQIENMIVKAHNGSCLCITHNPNNPWYIATGGEDGYVNIWVFNNNHNCELKKTLLGHTHWVTSVHFNPVYDQFILSSSTDCSLYLWKSFSTSSSIHKDIEDQADGLLINLEGVNASIYSSAWSPKLPWLFCGAGYDGKLYFGHIPKDEVNLSLF
ncbi:hypothetical protein WA158_001700 [Blastocystis sp. Blastoise]